MTLLVCSARLSTPDPDRLNVTRGSGGSAGSPFAPSHALLGRYLNDMKEAQAILDDAKAHEKTVSRARPDLGGKILDHAKLEVEAARTRAFEQYTVEFLAEMRRSYRKNWRAWRELLSRRRVVLTCYCVHPERCHRYILRTRILPILGAKDGGELPPEAQRRARAPKGTEP